MAFDNQEARKNLLRSLCCCLLTSNDEEILQRRGKGDNTGQNVIWFVIGQELKVLGDLDGIDYTSKESFNRVTLGDAIRGWSEATEQLDYAYLIGDQHARYGCIYYLNKAISEFTPGPHTLLLTALNEPLIDIIGSDVKTYYPDASVWSLPESVKNPSSSRGTSSSSSGGCYVATAVYGSYDCPEVWVLRRYRDYVLAETWYGRAFIKAYYAASPILVKLFGEEQWFKTFFRARLNLLVGKLLKSGFSDYPYRDIEW